MPHDTEPRKSTPGSKMTPQSDPPPIAPIALAMAVLGCAGGKHLEESPILEQSVRTTADTEREQLGSGESLNPRKLLSDEVAALVSSGHISASYFIGKCISRISMEEYDGAAIPNDYWQCTVFLAPTGTLITDDTSVTAGIMLRVVVMQNGVARNDVISKCARTKANCIIRTTREAAASVAQQCLRGDYGDIRLIWRDERLVWVAVQSASRVWAEIDANDGSLLGCNHF